MNCFHEQSPPMIRDRAALRALPPHKLAELSVARYAGQKLEELVPLIERVRECPPRVVVEIGTDKGGTLWLWCQLATLDAKIISIDLPGSQIGYGYSEQDTEIFHRWTHGDQQLHCLRADSHSHETKGQLMRILDEDPIDLLFIDGDHSYAGVSRDFQMYSPLVETNGLVVFHDIVETHPRIPTESPRFWNEIKGDYPRQEEIVDPLDDLAWRNDYDLAGPWGGIGIIWMP